MQKNREKMYSKVVMDLFSKGCHGPPEIPFAISINVILRKILWYKGMIFFYFFLHFCVELLFV